MPLGHIATAAGAEKYHFIPPTTTNQSNPISASGVHKHSSSKMAFRQAVRLRSYSNDSMIFIFFL